MPKNRRKAQRKREKKKQLWKPPPDMINSFGFKDLTPVNAARKNKGLTDHDGGGYLLR